MRRRYFGGLVVVAMALFITVAVALLSPQRGFELMFAALVLAALVPLVVTVRRKPL